MVLPSLTSPLLRRPPVPGSTDVRTRDRVLVALSLVAVVSATALTTRDDGRGDAAAASPGEAPGVPLLVVVGEGSATDEAVGRPAARVTGGSLVTVPHGDIPASVRATLSRSRPHRILVVGGPTAVSGATMAALARSTAGPTTRLAGADRYETAARVARSMFAAPVRRVHVMSGGDAAVPGAATELDGSDAPLLLVDGDRIPAATASALRQLRPASIEVLAAGSVVSEAALDELRLFTSGDVTRRTPRAPRG